MKKIFLIAALLWCITATAQQPEVPVDPAQTTSSVPEYAYCEIIAEHLPSSSADGVLFDFGQQTTVWAYNWMQNSEGQKIVFNSSIEALNYMVRRGWEFVQAYTSGEKSQNTHHLLRIHTSKLTESQLQQLLTEPRTKSDKNK